MSLLTNPMTVDDAGQPEPFGGADVAITTFIDGEVAGGIEVNYYWG